MSNLTSATQSVDMATCSLCGAALGAAHALTMAGYPETAAILKRYVAEVDAARYNLQVEKEKGKGNG